MKATVGHGAVKVADLFPEQAQGGLRILGHLDVNHEVGWPAFADQAEEFRMTRDDGEEPKGEDHLGREAPGAQRPQGIFRDEFILLLGHLVMLEVRSGQLH
jgi:hypothetical protein